MVNRIVVGAGYGLTGWLVQRISAVVMALYTVFLLVFVGCQRPLGYETWKALFTPLWMRMFSALAFAALLMHAWVGVRDILMDYVHPVGLRLSLEVATIVALAAYGVWFVQILWGA